MIYKHGKCNFLKIFILLLLVLILLFLINGLYNLYFHIEASNKIPELKFEFQVVNVVIGLASIFIAFSAYRIQATQSKIQKGQAVTQLNQAFNDINKLVLSEKGNEDFQKFVSNLYNVEKQGQQIDATIKNRDQIIPLIFIILNAYEAYYINNRKAFKPSPPLILRNLFKHYKETSEEILHEHSYDPCFKAVCKNDYENRCRCLFRRISG